MNCADCGTNRAVEGDELCQFCREDIDNCVLIRENALKEALEKAREQIKAAYPAHEAYLNWDFYKTIDECLKEHCE
jgi:hypothetical protein